MHDQMFQAINAHIQRVKDRAGDERVTFQCVIDPDLDPGVPILQDTTLRFHPEDAEDFDNRISALLQGRVVPETGEVIPINRTHTRDYF